MAEARKRKIIALATLKGGSGKSTIAACLAAYWLLDGCKVALFDTDPQGSLINWRQPDGPLEDLRIIANHTQTVGQAIAQSAGSYDVVVADTAGFRNRTTIAVLAATDIAIVPVKASPFDLRVAADTLQLIGEINATKERRHRKIVVAVLLTQTTPGSVIARHLRAEISEAGLPIMAAELANRVVYGEATLAGLTPSVVQPNGMASKEIAAVAMEIENM